MRNIPGSRFINNTRKHTKWFKRGLQYTLKNIKPEEKGIKYIFKDNMGSESDIVFEDAKQADSFLDQFVI